MTGEERVAELEETVRRLVARIEDLEDENAILLNRLHPEDTVPLETVKARLGL